MIQFQPPGTLPVWHGTLNAHIDRPNQWGRDPSLPVPGRDRPVLLLHHDQRTLFSSSRFPGQEPRAFLAGLVERTPDRVLFVSPPGRALENIDMHGVYCADVMSVYPLTPVAGRDCIIVFLDARQTANPIEHILLPGHRVEPSMLVRYLNLHAPPCHKVAFWPRPDAGGMLNLSEGDTVVFGYVIASDFREPIDGPFSGSSGSSEGEGSSDDDNDSDPGPHFGLPPPSPDGASAHQRNRSRTPRGRSARQSRSEPVSAPGVLSVCSKGLRRISPLESCGIAAHVMCPVDVGADFRSAFMCVPHLGSCAILVGNEADIPDFADPRIAVGHFDLCPEAVDPCGLVATVCCDGPLGLRLIPEPTNTPASIGGDEGLAALRYVTAELGDPWPYFPIGRQRPFGVLLEGDEHALDDAARICWVQVIVLKPWFTPEALQVTVILPGTKEELFHATQDVRDPLVRHDFPHLVEARPQPVQGFSILIANPSWHGHAMVACMDLTHYDGRLFAAQVPDYIDRRAALNLAELPDAADIMVFVGSDTSPLIDGAHLHVVCGVTIRFAQAEQFPLPPSTLEDMLMVPFHWSTEPLSQPFENEGCYCLALRHSSRIFFADVGRPMQYRDRLAASVGLPAHQVVICPASPRVVDAAVDGYPCRTVLAVANKTLFGASHAEFLFVVDCRQLMQGWLCFTAATDRVLAETVLEPLNEEAPLGWRVAVNGISAGYALLSVFPGAVFKATYFQDDAPDAAEIEAPIWESEHAVLTSNASITADADPHAEVPGWHAASVSGEHFLATFVIFMPDFRPEIVELHLRAPDTLARVLQAVSDRWQSPRRAFFPRLVEVVPQPDLSFASVIAAPFWTPTEVLILVDVRLAAKGVFALAVAPRLCRRSLLAIAALPISADLEVYVADSPFPARNDESFSLQEGTLVVIAVAPSPVLVTAYLSDMLLSQVGWGRIDGDLCALGRQIWVLAEPEPFGLSEYADSQALAASLGVDETDLLSFEAKPAILDHCDRGTPSLRVVIAADASDRTWESGASFCVLDMRPILQGLQLVIARGGLLDCSRIAVGLISVCPGHLQARFIGGAPGVALQTTHREVARGDVIQVIFDNRADLSVPVSPFHGVSSAFSRVEKGEIEWGSSSGLPRFEFLCDGLGAAYATCTEPDVGRLVAGRTLRRRPRGVTPARTCLFALCLFSRFDGALSVRSDPSDFFSDPHPVQLVLLRRAYTLMLMPSVPFPPHVGPLVGIGQCLQSLPLCMISPSTAPAQVLRCWKLLDQRRTKILSLRPGLCLRLCRSISAVQPLR